jgi:hypothetical protein
MARRTLNDFDAELLVRLANRSDITAAMRSFLLNDAMFKVGIMYEHSQLQKTTVEPQLISTDTFDIADGDLWWVEHMWNMTDNRTVTLGDMDKIEAMVKRTAPPMQYFTRASSIFLDSISNTAKQHKVFYVKKPAQWSVATAPAPYDEQYDQLLLMWAAKMGMETVRDFEAADLIGKQIGMYVSGMKLPVRKQQLNDINSRMPVRFR